MQGCKKLKDTKYGYFVDYYSSQVKEQVKNRLGKLITIEGSDGVGKETQSLLLVDALTKMGYKAMRLSFPNYKSPSSGPIKEYLSGKLGGINDLEPYAVSVLYAADRFCTIKELHIEKLLEDGYIIICDRYVESNFIHQLSKVICNEDKAKLVIDLIELEYGQLKLPIPDTTFYLSLPIEFSLKLLEERNGKKDIHESNKQYLTFTHETGNEMAELFEWNVINCLNSKNQLYAKESINKKIMSTLKASKLLDKVPKLTAE